MPREKDWLEKAISRRKKLGLPDVIRKEELDLILEKAREMYFVGLSGKAWQCLFALLWLFGKRISEVVSIPISSIRVSKTQLVITFTVRKKVIRRTKKDGSIKVTRKPNRKTKRITLKNPYTKYVTTYLDEIKERVKEKGIRQIYLFPSSHTRMVIFIPDMCGILFKSLSFRYGLIYSVIV